MTARLQAWVKRHSVALLAIRDTPEAIAGGVAIGVFFSFTPLFGLKTLLSVLLAWLLRANLTAAVIAVTLHDLALPFLPLLYRWEYEIGYWLLSRPHAWPEALRLGHLDGHAWRSWTTFFSVGKPWLVGSMALGAPAATVVYFLTRAVVARRQRRPMSEAREG